MGTRGRKSAASLEVLSPNAVSSVQRPDAPYDLTDEESAEWWAVVNRLPADWFPRETQPLLAQFCRHVVGARRVAQMVAQFEKAEDLDITALDKLYKMREREGRAMSSLATRLRITQQSTVKHEQARKPSLVKKPWDPA